MQKKTQLLKWALLTLLIVGGIGFSGNLFITQADAQETCTLYAISSGIGHTTIDASQVSSPGVQADTSLYNLQCPNQDAVCHLIVGSGNAILSLSAVQSAGSTTIVKDFSPNGTPYGLHCDGSGSSKPSSYCQVDTSASTTCDTSIQTETGFGCQTSDGSTCIGTAFITCPTTSGGTTCTTGETGFACQTTNNSSGSPCTGPAFSISSSSSSSSSTACNGTPTPALTPTPNTVNVNSSNLTSDTLPNSDCNSNTPPPAAGSCELAWKSSGGVIGGGGTTDLDTSKVTDTGLKATLDGTVTPPGYNLKCAEQHTSCTLIPGSSNQGSTNLFLDNIVNRSPWIYNALLNKYSLSCDNGKNSGKRPSHKSRAKKPKSKNSRAKKPTSNVVVKTAQATVNGNSETILTDTNGRTLYYFTSDVLHTVACTSANGCTTTWPPLLFTGTGTVKADKTLPGQLTTDTTVNGNQVVYNGHYLYTYAQDSAPGDTKGQGVGNTWFVATPDLT